MKQFIYIWIGWLFFISAITTLAGEISRYVIGDFIATRALFIWIVTSLSLTVWWYFVVKGSYREK